MNTTSIPNRSSKAVPPMELTERDEDIIRAVGRFRFLRSDQVTKLLNGSKQGVLRRLGRLYQHGYLSHVEKTTVQIALPGFKGLIYALGPKGRQYLLTHGVFHSGRQQEKKPKVPYLAHTLKVADFMIDLKRSLPEDVELYYFDEFRVLFCAKENVSWKVPIEIGGKETKIGLIPDYVFALVRGGEVCVYCLEIDRGTMPVVRRGPFQTSFLRKILAYHKTWRSNFAAENFDWSRFRVVTVTSSQERNAHLISSCQRACKNMGGSKLFLFSAESDIKDSPDLFRHRWETGKIGTKDAMLS